MSMVNSTALAARQSRGARRERKRELASGDGSLPSESHAALPPQSGRSAAKLPPPSEIIGALSRQVSADNLRAIAKAARGRGETTIANCREIEADEMDAAAAAILVAAEPFGPPGIGGELVPDADFMETAPAVFDTLKSSPDMMHATASRERLSLAAAAGALVQGADIAETMKARNSLERMLAQQLGAVHLMAMKFSEQATHQLSIFNMESGNGRDWHPVINAHPVIENKTRNLQALLVEASRAANTATRLMTAFQGGLLALDRIRRGGKQTVRVVHVHQHVAVGEGGQAVVAGTVKGRGLRRSSRGPAGTRDFPRSTRVGGGVNGAEQPRGESENGR